MLSRLYKFLLLRKVSIYFFGFLLLIVFSVNAPYLMFVVQAELYRITDIFPYKLEQTRSDYINVRITRMENCVVYEDSPASGNSALKAGCLKTFVGAVDRTGLEAAKVARASGNMTAAQGILERIYHEPLFRSFGSTAYPDFVTWWKGDAGFRCTNDMDKGSAAAVLVYCLGSRPDIVASFCSSQGSNKSRDGEPMFVDLCHPVSKRESEVLANDAFSYCFAGLCRYPDSRFGAFKSVSPLI